MTKRDYLIIFCLLLPFFITLPWALYTRSKLKKQRAKTEIVRDSLSYANWYYANRIEVAEEKIRSNQAILNTNRQDTPNWLGQSEEPTTTPTPVPLPPASAAATTTVGMEELSQQQIGESKPPPNSVPSSAARQSNAGSQNLSFPAPPIVSGPRPDAEPIAQASLPDPSTQLPPPIKKEKPATSAAVVAPTTPPPPKFIADKVRTAPVDARLREMSGLKDESTLRTGKLNVRLVQEVPEKTGPSPKNSRRFSVDFPLNNVPSAYQGQQSLYLVLTDHRGDPIAGTSPVSARVPLNGINIELTAIAKKDVRLGPDQHLRIDQKIQEGLPAGKYRVQVFSEMAVIGMADLTVL